MINCKEQAPSLFMFRGCCLAAVATLIRVPEQNKEKSVYLNFSVLHVKQP